MWVTRRYNYNISFTKFEKPDEFKSETCSNSSKYIDENVMALPSSSSSRK